MPLLSQTRDSNFVVWLVGLRNSNLEVCAVLSLVSHGQDINLILSNFSMRWGTQWLAVLWSHCQSCVISRELEFLSTKVQQRVLGRTPHCFNWITCSCFTVARMMGHMATPVVRKQESVLRVAPSLLGKWGRWYLNVSVQGDMLMNKEHLLIK